MRIKTVIFDFLGNEEIIGAFLLTGEGNGAALIETGPASCLDALLSGLDEHGVARGDVRHVFLTHVHLDHAGAAGHLAGLLPNATFYVHEIGYPHLADPSKLVRSATRIYGDQMDTLWGEMRPVPEDRLVSLSDGAEIEAAGTTLTAHDTPGHAYHHFAYLDASSGALFTGDVAGIRLPGQSYVRPPTPPPEIDVDAWQRSIGRVRNLDPSSILLTHFGEYEDVERHLGELEQRLQEWLLFVESRLDDGQSLDEITDELATKGDSEILSEGGRADDPDRYQLAGNYEMLVAGLARHVEKRRGNSPRGLEPNVSPGETYTITERSFERGLAVARRFIGTRYATWAPGDDERGPPLWTNRIPSVPEMRLRGAVCAAVVNVFLLANGEAPPASPGRLRGGTGAYGDTYDIPEYAMRYGAVYPRGTLFGSPYGGAELSRQGHVAIAVEDEENPTLIQSTYEAGWYESDRLPTLHPFTYAVPPGVWLG